MAVLALGRRGWSVCGGCVCRRVGGGCELHLFLFSGKKSFPEILLKKLLFKLARELAHGLESPIPSPTLQKRQGKSMFNVVNLKSRDRQSRKVVGNGC